MVFFYDEGLFKKIRLSDKNWIGKDNYENSFPCQFALK